MATSLRLYETIDQLEIVREWIDEHADAVIEAGGELPPELAELLDQAEGQLSEKVERVALYIRELLFTAATIKEARNQLTVRAKHMENAADGLKAYLKRQLERAGIPKVEAPLVTVRLQKNPPSIQCLDIGRAYAEHGDTWVERRVIETFDIRRDVVLAAHKAHEPVPAAFIVTQGQHVRIV